MASWSNARSTHSKNHFNAIDQENGRRRCIKIFSRKPLISCRFVMWLYHICISVNPCLFDQKAGFWFLWCLRECLPAVIVSSASCLSAMSPSKSRVSINVLIASHTSREARQIFHMRCGVQVQLYAKNVREHYDVWGYMRCWVLISQHSKQHCFTDSCQRMYLSNSAYINYCVHCFRKFYCSIWNMCLAADPGHELCKLRQSLTLICCI